MPRAQDLLFLAGRSLLGGFYLQNGSNHYANVKQMTQYAESKGVQTPYLAVIGSGTLLLVAGTTLITGRRPKLGIAAAALFFAGVTPKMHRFWEMEQGPERMNELVNFSKNLALVGATLALAAVPEPWPLSIRTKKAHHRIEEPAALEEYTEMGHS